MIGFEPWMLLVLCDEFARGASTTPLPVSVTYNRQEKEAGGLVLEGGAN